MIVSGPVRRKRINADSFAAWPSAGFVRVIARDDSTAGGIEFTGTLTPDQQTEIWWWMTSESDDDMTRRQSLAALRDTADPGLCAALVAYVLGEAL